MDDVAVDVPDTVGDNVAEYAREDREASVQLGPVHGHQSVSSTFTIAPPFSLHFHSIFSQAGVLEAGWTVVSREGDSL